MVETSPSTAGYTVSVTARLGRLLKPSSIAFVGLSDNSYFLETVSPTFDSDAEIFMVNPRHASVAGWPTVGSLTSLDRPIDAVMSFMSAERTTELVEEAAELDIGGMVLVASGFAELGAGGEEMQARLRSAAAAASMPVIGPNGLGYINVRHGISLSVANRHKRRPGGISVVSQSGAITSGIAMSAWDYPDCGTNILVSSGNEAITDLADYIDYFVEDPETTSIGLVIEKIRRPQAFFAAVARATAAGKPVVALKLARNERSQRLAASHTGALTGDAWVYDVALRQAGVALAYDTDELVDRLALADQLPRQRWTSVSSLGVVTVTGGYASMSMDLAVAEGVHIPPLDGYVDWAKANLPGVSVPNPLDATGFGTNLWPEIIEKYTTDPDLDAILVVHPVADEDSASAPMFDAFALAAGMVDKPCVVANCSGVPGDWIAGHLGGTLVRGRGVRGTLRGLATLGRFVAYRDRPREDVDAVPAITRPTRAPIPQPEGLMLPFGATMDLLAEHGIPVAPYCLAKAETDASSVRPTFAGPYVVKLADVAHRTEHDAVRLGVDEAGLATAITELRAIAAADGLPPEVAIQPMLEIIGETLLGIQGQSELGPLVAFGPGGVFVEVLNRVSGRMAPFGLDEARSLIDEFADLKLMHGFRGRPAWDLDGLATILLAAGRLAAGGEDWIATLDINPLVYGPAGYCAVDALLLLQP